MQKILMLALMSILERVDIAAVIEAIFKRFGFPTTLAGVYAGAKEQIPEPVLERIAVLVQRVDDLDLPGEEKFKEVLTALTASGSPVSDAAASIPERLIRWAIQTAYVNLRAG